MNWFELSSKQEIETYLNENSEFDVNVQNDLKQTLLYLRAINNDRESVNFLLEKNGDPNLFDSLRMTPLLKIMSKIEKDISIRQIALDIIKNSKELDVYHQGYLCGTALSYALYLGQIDLAKTLVNKERLLAGKFDPAQHPDLLLCVIRGESIEALQFLLSQSEFNCNSVVKADWIEHPDWIWRFASELEEQEIFCPLDYESYRLSADEELIYDLIENDEIEKLKLFFNAGLVLFDKKDKNKNDMYLRACELARQNKNDKLLQLIQQSHPMNQELSAENPLFFSRHYQKNTSKESISIEHKLSREESLQMSKKLNIDFDIVTITQRYKELELKSLTYQIDKILMQDIEFQELSALLCTNESTLKQWLEGKRYPNLLQKLMLDKLEKTLCHESEKGARQIVRRSSFKKGEY